MSPRKTTTEGVNAERIEKIDHLLSYLLNSENHKQICQARVDLACIKTDLGLASRLIADLNHLVEHDEGCPKRRNKRKLCDCFADHLLQRIKFFQNRK